MTDELFYRHACPSCGRVTYDCLPLLVCPVCHGHEVVVMFDQAKRERELTEKITDASARADEVVQDCMNMLHDPDVAPNIVARIRRLLAGYASDLIVPGACRRVDAQLATEFRDIRTREAAEAWLRDASVVCEFLHKSGQTKLRDDLFWVATRHEKLCQLFGNDAATLAQAWATARFEGKEELENDLLEMI